MKAKTKAELQAELDVANKKIAELGSKPRLSNQDEQNQNPLLDFGDLLMKGIYNHLCYTHREKRFERDEIVLIAEESDRFPEIYIGTRSGGDYVVTVRKVAPEFKSLDEQIAFWNEHDIYEYNMSYQL